MGGRRVHARRGGVHDAQGDLQNCSYSKEPLSFREGTQRSPPHLARSSSPGHPPGLAAATQKMSQRVKSLEGKRREGLEIKLHEVEERRVGLIISKATLLAHSAFVNGPINQVNKEEEKKGKLAK